MAARRLADRQPEAFAWSEDNLRWCAAQIEKFPQGRQASCVIPFLWRGQKQEGWVSVPMMQAIADQLEMPYIRVLEVATFYTMFNLEPVGEHFVQLCGTTPCMLRGSEDLKDVCRKVIGEQNAITSDGKLSWLEVECLGACVNAPMVQISNRDGDEYYEDLTPDTFEGLLKDLQAGRPVAPGTRNPNRFKSAPEGGAKTLTDPALYDGAAARPLDNVPHAEPAE
ncbi:MAG: NADH-quinone oxidoreductase subunit NuoE [Pseudomonadota bacterium]